MDKIYSYGVIFKNSNKKYRFKSSEKVDINTFVIVDTESGNQYGKIVDYYPEDINVDSYKEIIRISTKEDEEVYFKNLKDADVALNKCKKLVSDLKLDMTVINSQYNFDRTQLLINFSADDRVDFRELAKRLASLYKTRIELRQIGARDKAKHTGGIGICGQTLCCTRYLSQIDSISMNKAKNQGLALNPNKINGACGRLLCCLNYEDAEYSRCRKGLLTIGTEIKYNGEKAKIVGIDVLKRSYKLQIGENRIDVSDEELNGSKK